jgi:hypothetical protein
VEAYLVEFGALKKVRSTGGRVRKNGKTERNGGSGEAKEGRGNEGGEGRDEED